jgi:hypothetical protein
MGADELGGTKGAVEEDGKAYESPGVEKCVESEDNGGERVACA